MSFIVKISDFIIPMVIFYIVALGLANRVKVYEVFIKGAKDGLKIVVDICPTLIGLMTGVGILRSSGFLVWLGECLGNVITLEYFPPQLFPLAIVKMFSSSAATGLVLDIFKIYGTDSYMGLLTSIMMSSTETVFYTMSVYYMAAKVNKVRWTLAGALFATLCGIVASVFMTICFNL